MFLKPDPRQRAIALSKKMPNDVIEVVNDVIKQYNAGVTRGSTKTKFRDYDAHYCDKVKDIFGDELLMCSPENLKDKETDRIHFLFK
jgi:hypothetical protein